MKKILLSLALLLSISNIAHAATTYYVRVNGGSGTQCLGTTNADYSGTGINQACAFNHPAWVQANINATAKWVGGDTMIIDDNGGTAQYPIGFGMPNSPGCNVSAPYDVPCNMRSVPSGPDASHTTKIYGSAYNTGAATKPQLYGVYGTPYVLGVTGANNIDIETLEITDHSNCTWRGGGNVCSENWGSNIGNWGKDGIRGVGVNNMVLKNIDIHGMANRGMELGDAGGVTSLSHVNIDGNGQAGWDGDESQYGGTGSINNGTMNWDFVNIRYNGCVEAYPRSGSFSDSDYGGCFDQNASGYGDGVGSSFTGGNWNITNCNISKNASDGLDLKYCKNCQTVNIDKTITQGNVGNQLKLDGKFITVTNSAIISNCHYLSLSGKVYNTSTFADCRAGGDAYYIGAEKGGVYKTINTSIYSDGASDVLLVDNFSTCDGTETYSYRNDIFASSGNSLYINQLGGACATPVQDTDYSMIYNVAGATCPSGAHNKCATNPLWTIVGSAANNVPNMAMTFSSPGKGAGTTQTFWNTPNDLNRFPPASPRSMGALEYQSVLTLTNPGQACTANSDCAAGTCSNFACTGTCTNNGGACSGSDGSTCCSGTCTSSVCAVPATCGDGVVQPGETCDGSALNGQNCTLQGYTGGSLSCAADCHSYVTSSCTNTTLFPLTPIVDTFTRSNSTGLGANWTNLVGSMNISSNAAIPINGSNSTNKYYWTPSTFLADEEVYATISNKGSNGDDIELLARFDPTTGKGYKLEPDVAGGQIHVYRVDPGENQLGANIAQTFATGDSIGMSVVGSTITVWYKASAGSWTSKGTRTDTTYTTGGSLAFGSFTGAGATPDIKFTNFGGGSLNPITCGNGLKETGETCDGADLASQTCVGLGYASGTLSCASNCQSYITSSCVSASVCGNNTKETGEACDGTDKNSQTCTGLGFASGSLSCAVDCKSFVTTSCVSSSSSGVRGGVTIK